MTKRKNDWAKMAAKMLEDRYFVWTILAVVVVGGGLWTQIGLAKIEMDNTAASQSLAVVHRGVPTISTHRR